MKKSNFIEGTLIATLAIVFTKILGMIYVIPFYAIIGSLGSALYAYAYNIYVMFLDISTAGIPSAISKIVKEYDTLEQKEPKVRTIKIATKIIASLSIVSFLILIVFAKGIAILIIGNMTGGNTVDDIAFVIRCVSFAILIVPLLSILRGYLQGHKIISVSSSSQIIEQVLRVATILVGSYLLVKVFKLPIKYGVGIATFGAFVGALASLLYVAFKCYKSRKQLNLDKKLKKDESVKDREIIHKIIKYAIPMILVSVIIAIYDNVDMILISRFTHYFGYDPATVEFVSTSIATWSKKILMIITSIGTGLTVSLIPNMVEAYTLKDHKLLNNHFNKALEIVLTVCCPMVLGICILAGPIWTIFYGYNTVGAHILSVNIFTAIMLNLFMVTNFTLQSINSFKVVYKSALFGYLTNIILDITFMNLLHLLKLPIYYGAIIASMCGYVVSITIALRYLRKHYHFSYQETLNNFKKTIIPMIGLVLVAGFSSIAINFNPYNRYMMVSKVIMIALPVALGYIYALYKLKVIDTIFGKDFFLKMKNKIFKKRV